VERAAGAKPGAPLQIDYLGSTALENAIHRAGHRFLVAGIAGLAGATVLAGWLAYAGGRRDRLERTS
jgi:hypothetical protein